MKACKQCGIHKPFTDFHVALNCKDGRTGTCKACMYAAEKVRKAAKRAILRTCAKCKQAKPLDSFRLHPGSSDGRARKCRECKQSVERANGWLAVASPEALAAAQRRARHAGVVMTEKHAARIKKHGDRAESQPSDYRANRIGNDEDARNAEARRALEDRRMMREPSAAEYYFGGSR